MIEVFKVFKVKCCIYKISKTIRSLDHPEGFENQGIFFLFQSFMSMHSIYGSLFFSLITLLIHSLTDAHLLEVHLERWWHRPLKNSPQSVWLLKKATPLKGFEQRKVRHRAFSSIFFFLDFFLLFLERWIWKQFKANVNWLLYIVIYRNLNN